MLSKYDAASKYGSWREHPLGGKYEPLFKTGRSASWLVDAYRMDLPYEEKVA